MITYFIYYYIHSHGTKNPQVSWTDLTVNDQEQVGAQFKKKKTKQNCAAKRPAAVQKLMWQHTSSCKASSQLIVLPSWMDFGSVSSVQPLPFNTVSSIVNEPFTRKDALVILHPGKKKQKTAGQKNMAHAQASAVASFVTHYPLILLIPSPRAIATLSPQLKHWALWAG